MNISECNIQDSLNSTSIRLGYVKLAIVLSLLMVNLLVFCYDNGS